MEKYECKICGYVYDPKVGDKSTNVKPGTKWENLPENWVCDVCGAKKNDFKKVEK